jgi:hypothetical protein
VYIGEISAVAFSDMIGRLEGVHSQVKGSFVVLIAKAFINAHRFPLNWD